MSASEEVLGQYMGQQVPFSFHAGFVSLSYAISLVGAASTLELIRRRTSNKGFYNLALLVGAAISMGGISIWSMHFIGNRAIDILYGQPELQIAYSTKLTALSFFVPILVLLLAFVAVSSNSKIRWWQIVISGTLSGGAICGMHYLGDAAISNYRSAYELPYVVGAALIAVTASTTALALFFVFDASWTNAWWRRLGCAMVLAGAVSGMHWCAAVGTKYKLLHLSSRDNPSRGLLIIVVICLSVSACVVMVASAAYSSWVRRAYATKAQQVVLAAAVFDDKGRIMVNQDGLLPSEVVTDEFIPKTNTDVFDTAHPLFHWMYRASRNWTSITNVFSEMSAHIGLLSNLKNNRMRVQLVGDDGTMVDKYDIIIRELFCLAASALASKRKETLKSAGILWDEIFVTGNTSKRLRVMEMEQEGAGSSDTSVHQPSTSRDIKRMLDLESLAEKGLYQRQQEFGRGSLMFLVRHVSSRREMDRIESSGFRFTELHQVVGTIRSSMQIKTPDFQAKLRCMSAAPESHDAFTPKVHLGIFAVRARLDHSGFNVLVQKNARNLLPAVPLATDHLQQWQLTFLSHLHGLTISTIKQLLVGLQDCSKQETHFAKELLEALNTLKAWFDDSMFDDAVLTSKIVQVPCSPMKAGAQAATCSLISFRLVIPIHSMINFPRCEFTPLQFFKVRQLVYEGSPHHVEFSHIVHREMSSMLQPVTSRTVSTSLPDSSSGTTTSKNRLVNRLRRLFTRQESPPLENHGFGRSEERLSAVISRRSSGYKHGDDMSVDDGQKPHYIEDTAFEGSKITATKSSPSHLPFGGIMVSQEIMINVQEKRASISSLSRKMTDSDSTPTECELSVIEEARSNTSTPLQNFRTAVAVGELNDAAENGGKGSAFVDELLALCMDRAAS